MKTEAQAKVYEYVIEFINDHGYSPTVRQVCDALGYSSTATAQQHIRSLVEKGYLRGAGRSLQPGDAGVE